MNIHLFSIQVWNIIIPGFSKLGIRVFFNRTVLRRAGHDRVHSFGELSSTITFFHLIFFHYNFLPLRFLPAKLFFRQNYSSMETFFHFLRDDFCTALKFLSSRFLSQYRRFPGARKYSSNKVILPARLFFHGNFLPFPKKIPKVTGRQFKWKKVSVEE